MRLRLPHWTIIRPNRSNVVSLTRSFAQCSNHIAETAIDRPAEKRTVGRTDGRTGDWRGQPTYSLKRSENAVIGITRSAAIKTRDLRKCRMPMDETGDVRKREKTSI